LADGDEVDEGDVDVEPAGDPNLSSSGEGASDIVEEKVDSGENVGDSVGTSVVVRIILSDSPGGSIDVSVGSCVGGNVEDFITLSSLGDGISDVLGGIVKVGGRKKAVVIGCGGR